MRTERKVPQGKKDPQIGGKKIYVAPKITEFGSLRSMTLAGASVRGADAMGTYRF